MTFAIAARCARTGRLGVAISTNPIGVGARCPFIAPRIGIVVTMARTDPRWDRCANLLRRPRGAGLLARSRQATPGSSTAGSVIDRDGHSAARTVAHTKTGPAPSRARTWSRLAITYQPKTADAMAEALSTTEPSTSTIACCSRSKPVATPSARSGVQHSAGRSSTM